MPYRERISALLGQGYFPKELPFAFTTRNFGDNAEAIIGDWRKDKVFDEKPKKIKGKFQRGSYHYNKIGPFEIEIISTPKRGFERRNLHITHPIPQALLSHEIARDWSKIQKWLSRKTLSLDEIRISVSFKRSIKGINFLAHNSKKAFIEGTSDWIVKTDIARFYPSIYTHSIAWAAYGKAKVKSNLPLYAGSLADRIDVLVRACNQNQTIGIPIGPETSRIIAEVISTRMDTDFRISIPNFHVSYADRLQDDWFVGVSSLECAEKVLSTISGIYREYGLEINGSKTSINRVIASSENYWISEIGAFLSHRPGPLGGNRLTELLALCLRLQIDHPTDPVINYALTILENQQIKNIDVDRLESFLLKATIVSPISMDRICRLLLNIQYSTKRVSRQRISDRFTLLAERDIENGHIYEAIWKLYTLRGLRLPLKSKSICQKSEAIPSSALALILLDMRSKGLCVHALPEGSWVKRISDEATLTTWSWLMAYEGIRNGWLSDPSKIMDGPFLRAMASRNVAFYDSRRNVPVSKKVTLAATRIREKNKKTAYKFMQLLRGFQPY